MFFAVGALLSTNRLSAHLNPSEISCQPSKIHQHTAEVDISEVKKRNWCNKKKSYLFQADESKALLAPGSKIHISLVYAKTQKPHSRVGVKGLVHCKRKETSSSKRNRRIH